MSNTYNIYRLKFEELDNLLKKINSVGLVEQKTQVYDNYEMTFFFSENIEGNDIWWHETYKTSSILQRINKLSPISYITNFAYQNYASKFENFTKEVMCDNSDIPEVYA